MRKRIENGVDVKTPNSQTIGVNATMFQDTRTEPRLPTHETPPLSTAPEPLVGSDMAGVQVSIRERRRRYSSGTPYSFDFATWQKRSTVLCYLKGGDSSCMIRFPVQSSYTSVLHLLVCGIRWFLDEDDDEQQE